MDETDFASFSSKDKRSIHAKNTVFPRGHCPDSDSEWIRNCKEWDQWQTPLLAIMPVPSVLPW
jgi:hypothetical protein